MSNVLSFSKAQDKKAQINKTQTRSKYYDNTNQETIKPFMKLTWNGFKYLPGFWCEVSIPDHEVWNDFEYDPEPNFPQCG